MANDRLSRPAPISNARVSAGNTRQGNDGTSMAPREQGPRKFEGPHDATPITPGSRNLWKDDFQKPPK
jgi:hypothetical protein